MRPQAAEPRTRLVVYPALLQRDKFEPVLQKLTEIGAAAIVPLLTARGVVREAPDEHRQMRWRSILRESAEQCGRGVPGWSGRCRLLQRSSARRLKARYWSPTKASGSGQFGRLWMGTSALSRYSSGPRAGSRWTRLLARVRLVGG